MNSRANTPLVLNNNSSTSFCLGSMRCRTDLSIHFQPSRPTTIWMFFSVTPTLSSSTFYYQVKYYRRGIADFFGVILLKRRRIAGEVSTLWAWQDPGMSGDGRFLTIYIHTVCIYKHMYKDYIYNVALLIWVNNGQDNCVCVANSNCESDIHIVAFTIIGPY